MAIVLSGFAWTAGAQELTPIPATLVSDAKATPNIALPTEQDLARWSKPIEAIQLRPAAPQGPVPTDGSSGLFEEEKPASALSRSWACTEFQWCASELVHRPLYFDDIPLERYGQTACPVLQPALSGARFFATIPLLPAKMIVDPPCSCVYSYGLYRPGSPTPCIRQRLVGAGMRGMVDLCP
jgi:hypothetical protein